MSNCPKESEIREFFDAWSIYDQVLDRNYMHHEELYTNVRQFLENRYSGRPPAVLDLGCGSARHLARALSGIKVGRYLGYDLSKTALSAAADNLKDSGGPIELREGDLLEGLKQNRQRFDLVFSGFALHHLDATDKSAFFRSAFEGLQDPGILLLIDVMREENETLTIYLDRYCDWIQSEWRGLPPAAVDAICTHVQNNDRPEKGSTLCAMATEAGFAEGFEISAYRWHRLCCFKKGLPPV
ncbi:MAG: class I SAM-dependent methyltransferase [Gammaproteobacteria bacterium]